MPCLNACCCMCFISFHNPTPPLDTSVYVYECVFGEGEWVRSMGKGRRAGVNREVCLDVCTTMGDVVGCLCTNHLTVLICLILKLGDITMGYLPVFMLK